jgi:hypothetical protein
LLINSTPPDGTCQQAVTGAVHPLRDAINEPGS